MKSDEDEETGKIPLGIEEGQNQELVRLIPEQHFTQPPPRYSEASLVQALEEDLRAERTGLQLAGVHLHRRAAILSYNFV